MFTSLHSSEPKSSARASASQGKATPFFQAKLTVNLPGDAHEQEADAVADQVMRMREGDAPIVQRMPLTPVSNVMRACAECEKEKMQRKETSPTPALPSMGGSMGDASGKAAPSIVSDVLSSGGGHPMDGGTRQFMESRFGQDFSQVRIHTDSRAAESASAIQARAYTSGRDVVFGAGEYQPSSDSGRRLLAHELVHVGQQGDEKVRRFRVNLEGWGGTLAGDDSYLDIDSNVSFWQNSRRIHHSIFDQSRRVSVNLEPGFEGVMQMRCHVHAFRDMNFNNEESEETYVMNCPLSVDSSGNITVRECSISGGSGAGDGSISFEVNDVQPESRNHLVTRGLRIRYTSTMGEGHSFSGGGEGAFEPFGTGGAITGSYSREYSMGDPRRGVFDLLVDISTPTVPTVEVGPIRVTHSRNFYFRTGSAALGGGDTERLRLRSWVRGLDSSSDGGSGLRFTVTGYASRLGDAGANERLSLRRAEAIHQIIRSILPRADFANPIPLGELSGFEAGRTEGDDSQSDRSVTVSYERIDG